MYLPMKLSQLIAKAQEALEKYGDLEINARYLPGDAWMPMNDYDGLISLNESDEELELNLD